MSFEIFRQTEGERENIAELRLGWDEVEWEENDISQEEDCSTKTSWPEYQAIWNSLWSGYSWSRTAHIPEAPMPVHVHNAVTLSIFIIFTANVTWL
jgi:hypothetical protein